MSERKEEDGGCILRDLSDEGRYSFLDDEEDSPYEDIASLKCDELGEPCVDVGRKIIG